MKIYIIGSGAIGKSLAVALKLQQKDVVIIRGSIDNGIAGTENIQVISEDGLVQEASIEVSTLSNYEELKGIILLTNKSYGNVTLSGTLKEKAGTSPVVLLQNGLGVEAPFIEKEYPEIYRCVLFVTSQILSENSVRFKPVSVCPIGIVRGSNAMLESIVEQLSGSYFQFRAEENIEMIIWKKAIINSVFNSVCPLLEADNGIFHRNEKAREIAGRVIAECVAIAGEKQVFLETEDVMNNLLHISRSSDGQLISTLQDINNKRQTEIDTLNFEIVRIAKMLHKEEAVKETKLLGELTKLKSELRGDDSYKYLI